MRRLPDSKRLERAGPADEKAQLADAEMHVIGVYWSKEGLGERGPVTVESLRLHIEF